MSAKLPRPVPDVQRRPPPPAAPGKVGTELEKARQRIAQLEATLARVQALALRRNGKESLVLSSQIRAALDGGA